jgi:hypothetical protein
MIRDRCTENPCCTKYRMKVKENKNAPLLTEHSFGLAERAGFEPAVPLPVRQFSKLFLSASQASLRTGRKGKTTGCFSKGNFCDP